MRRIKIQQITRFIVITIFLISLYYITFKPRRQIADDLSEKEVEKKKVDINYPQNAINNQNQPPQVPPQANDELKHLNIAENNRNNNNDVTVIVNGVKMRKIDWHNYKQIAEDTQRHGPGEQGLGVVLSAKENKASEKESLFRANGFNAYASDKISLQRTLNDIRHTDCKKRLYLEKLPKISVIIPFHDEHLSVLLRSVYSIVKQTPDSVLEEIILVDDYSTKDTLGQALDKHIEANFKAGLVKVLRLKKREGLIRTRLAGAREAKGEVLVFFDSHVECNVNWAPPLLEPIALDYKTSVCPFIDVINEDTFAYSAQDEGARGAFDWDLYYKRLPLLEASLRNPSEPFESPVMAGGLFAISAKWFWELGGYDAGLDIWGGEQYELSFKIWQCGGKLVDAPCSHVGHIYRKFNPFGAAGSGDFLTRNHKRVAEVWMDEYKNYFYKNSSYILNIDAGDLSKQKEIREKLHCKGFKWFMDTVAFDLVQYYPPVPPKPYASGELRSFAAALCIDTKFKHEESTFGLDTCLRDNRDHSGEQKFELTWRHDIRPINSDRCFDASRSSPGAPVVLFKCHGYRGNQEFLYNTQTLQIYHPVTNNCLDASIERKEIFMNPCDKTKKTQQWQFQYVNTTMIQSDFKFPF